MPRFPQPQINDTPVRRDLDGGFLGVDNRRDRGLLAQGGPGDAAGLVADAINVRMGTTQPETRGGCVMPIHFQAGWATIQGVGVYSAPNGSEWIVVADTNRIYLMADGRTPRELLVPPTHPLGAVEIVQAFEKLLFCRGEEAPVLEWGGAWTHDLVPVTASPVPPDQSDYLDPLPGVAFGMVMSDRFFFPIGRDTVGWSDILDYTRYDAAFSVARLNHGEDDSIVALARYQGNRLIVFKTQSIYYLNNVFGDMSGVTVDRLPSRIGCVARRSVAEVGGDLMWLGDKGVYRLSQTEQDSLRSVPVPVSLPIEGYLKRINWNKASQACGAVAGNYYLLAVPIDNSERNNALLVYDLTTGMWQGLDYYGAAPAEAGDIVVPEIPTVETAELLGQSLTIAPDYPTAIPVLAQTMVVSDYAGERSAFMSDGQRIVALGHGTVDRLDGRELDIYTRVETRGYILGEIGEKSILAAEAFYATRGASVSLSILTDGPNEVLPLTTRRTRDRTRYTMHGRGRFDVSNLANNYDAPNREDYAWIAGDGPMMNTAGVPLSTMQEWKHPLPVRRFGRWFSVRIESWTGTLRLVGVQVDALPERHSYANR